MGTKSGIIWIVVVFIVSLIFGGVSGWLLNEAVSSTNSNREQGSTLDGGGEEVTDVCNVPLLADSTWEEPDDQQGEAVILEDRFRLIGVKPSDSAPTRSKLGFVDDLPESFNFSVEPEELSVNDGGRVTAEIEYGEGDQDYHIHIGVSFDGQSYAIESNSRVKGVWGQSRSYSLGENLEIERIGLSKVNNSIASYFTDSQGETYTMLSESNFRAEQDYQLSVYSFLLGEGEVSGQAEFINPQLDCEQLTTGLNSSSINEFVDLNLTSSTQWNLDEQQGDVSLSDGLLTLAIVDQPTPVSVSAISQSRIADDFVATVKVDGVNLDNPENGAATAEFGLNNEGVGSGYINVRNSGGDWTINNNVIALGKPVQEQEVSVDAPDGEAIYLRITRANGALIFAYSTDGSSFVALEEYKDFTSYDLGLSLYSFNIGEGDSTVTMSELEIM